MRKISAKNIKLCVNFSHKLPGFSEIIELGLNLGIKFFVTCLVLSKYTKVTPKKPVLIKPRELP